MTASSFRLISTRPTFIYSVQVTPLNTSGNPLTAHYDPASRTRYIDTPEHGAHEPWPYRRPMPPRNASRKVAFAAFVRKALDDARTTRAWTGAEVSRRTGISRQTLNRWVRGEWASDPEAERVVAFCEGLGINPAIAFGVLGWNRSGPTRQAPATPPMDPDVEALLRRLVDPKVSEAEKFHIRETIRYLAYRPALPIDPYNGREQAG